MAEPTQEQIARVLRKMMERSTAGQPFTALDLKEELGCTLDEALGVIAAVRIALPAGVEAARREVRELQRQLPARIITRPGNA